MLSIIDLNKWLMIISFIIRQTSGIYFNCRIYRFVLSHLHNSQFVIFLLSRSFIHIFVPSDRLEIMINNSFGKTSISFTNIYFRSKSNSTINKEYLSLYLLLSCVAKNKNKNLCVFRDIKKYFS
jgi:hypothetical protein